MSSIFTPLTLWNDFDDSPELNAEVSASKISDGIVFENVRMLGRETGQGRVNIFGVYAYSEEAPSGETVMIFPDSSDGIDEDIIKLFVGRGYSVLMIDYRGEWEGCENYTVYPENIEYANTVKCGRHKDFADRKSTRLNSSHIR